MLKESDIQNYIHKNLHRLPKWIDLTKLNKKYLPTRELLINEPATYLAYKKMQKIFDRMNIWYFEDPQNLCKFPKEYITAEKWCSRPRVDILGHTPDPDTFWICEVKYNKDPERQTITELLQYANWLQLSDFPWLSNDNIIFVIVAKEWSNILIQSVINWIFFRGLNILPLEIPKEIKSITDLRKHRIKFFDIFSTDAFQNFNKQIYDENNYCYRLVAFDSEKNREDKKNFLITNNDKMILSTLIGNEYSKLWYNWTILFLEDNPEHFAFRFIFAIIIFDPFGFENKVLWFSHQKTDLLWKFHEKIDSYTIDESYAKEQIKFMFSKEQIRFESWYAWWRWLSWISNKFYLFSYAYPIGWFHEIIFDAIKFSREDIRWWDEIFWWDDFNSQNELYSWYYISKLFDLWEK